jgi:hypothetical protein
MSLESAFFYGSVQSSAFAEKVNETTSVDFQSNGQSISYTWSSFGQQHEEKKEKTQNSFNRYICNKQQHLDGSKAKAFSGVQGCGRERRKKIGSRDYSYVVHLYLQEYTVYTYTPISPFYIHQSTVFLHTTKKAKEN